MFFSKLKGPNQHQALWLDVAQCGTSEINPPVQSGKFTSKYSWTANIEGEILGAGGVSRPHFFFFPSIIPHHCAVND
jgi:hypothetical protein